jgi:hypothetical protein
VTDDFDLGDRLELARLRRTSPGEYLLQQLGERNRDRLVASVDNGVPVESLVVTARWWQLETYLRLFIYIQLRAQYGDGWSSALGDPRPEKRANAATARRYMASPDDSYLIAHLDVSTLFALIESHWEQCEHGVGLPKSTWLATSP